jgi:hypothetical protein
MVRGGPERMQRANRHLKNIKEAIDQGQSGTTIALPIKEAVLTLRIPAQTLENLKKRDQVLGVSVKEGYVIVKLQESPHQQREDYAFLYGLIQSLKNSQADKFLKTQKAPSSLTKEIPSFDETLAVVEGGNYDLSEEDLVALHLQLQARWSSLSDKTDLFPPKKVFT